MDLSSGEKRRQPAEGTTGGPGKGKGTDDRHVKPRSQASTRGARPLRGDTNQPSCDVEQAFRRQSLRPRDVESHDLRSRAGEAYDEGDRVEALYRAWWQYFPAVITARHRDGSVDVLYDDGYAESNLPEKLLRAPKPFVVGDKVEARFRGWRTYYPGTVVQVKDASYDVAYDVGYTETDVPRRHVRPRRTAAVTPDAPPPRPLDEPGARSAGDQDERVPEAAALGFRPGARVAARFRGRRKRYAATIVARQADSTYDAHAPRPRRRWREPQTP